MHEEALRLRAELGRDCLKRIGRDFREAYVASRFAQHRSAPQVKLLRPNDSTPTPDFSIKIDEKEYWFETTEIDRASRRRGDEKSFEEIRPLYRDEWISARDYFEEVRKRVRSKSVRSYVKCDGLIVWSNAFAIIDDEIIDDGWWASATTPAAGSFKECWVWHRDSWQKVF